MKTIETKYQFSKMSVETFEDYITQLKIGRTIVTIQEHHTYVPSYIDFKGNNHFELQKGMKSYHVNQNGWGDIGQHLTIFPDGMIVTGRSMEKSPACIYGNNANSICIENLGNFDLNGDIMTEAQSDSIIRVTAALCRKFNLAANTNSIVYHHWFNLSTGERNNGTKNNKSCPGTNFFEGNKVANCETSFIPKVYALLNSETPNVPLVDVIKYAVVNTTVLNVRTGPSRSKPIAKDRISVRLGSILRIYKEEKGWIKISSSAEHWVSGRYTKEAKRCVVTVDGLNVRTGPSVKFPKINSLQKQSVLFIIDEKNGWCQISTEEGWVKKSFLNFD